MIKFFHQNSLIYFLLKIALSLQVIHSCQNFTDIQYFVTSISPPNTGIYSIFLWDNDWNTNNHLSPETLQCFASKSIFNSIGLYIDSDFGAGANWVYDFYNSEVLELFAKLTKPLELIFYLKYDNISDVADQINKAFDPVQNLSSKIDMVWIRPDVDPNCPEPTSYIDCQFQSAEVNADLLIEAIQLIKARGFNVGISTNSAAWMLTINQFGANYFDTYPLIYDGEDYKTPDPSFSDFESFAGFDSPAAKLSAIWYYDMDCCWFGQVMWSPNTSTGKSNLLLDN